MERSKVKELSAAMNEALKQVEESFGVQIQIGRCSFGENNASFKVEVSEKSSDGKVITKEAEAFKRNARFYGLQADDLGREFTTPDGKTFTITGLNSRGRKYPILGSDASGKSYKFPSEMVASMISTSLKIS